MRNFLLSAILKTFAEILPQSLLNHTWRLILLGVTVSIVELAGISLLMPFVQSAVDFSAIERNAFLHWLFEIGHFEDPSRFVTAFGIFLVLFYLIRGALNILFFYCASLFSKQVFKALSVRLFASVLHLPVHLFRQEGATRITQALGGEVQNVASIVLSLITIAIESLIVVLLYLLMLTIDWRLTLDLTLFLGLNALLLRRVVGRLSAQTGLERSQRQKRFFHLLGNALANYVPIRLRSAERLFLKHFQTNADELAKTMVRGETASHIPRLYLETLGFITVALLVVYWIVAEEKDISAHMGVLAFFIIALYRMMPSVNRILTHYHQVLYLKPALDLVIDLLHRPAERVGQKPLSFRREFALCDVAFDYGERPVFIGLNLKINKGEKVAVIGESGGGKSTLLGLLTGLLRPREGDLCVDGEKVDVDTLGSWRARFGYVPQEVTLFDATLAENIAIAEDKIDRQRIKTVIRQVRLEAFVRRLPKGIDTPLGEGGIEPSGGQKQRLALARALYNDPDILVLDEATSALDPATEVTVMETVHEVCQNKTLIVVAHRPTAIAGCERILCLEEGSIVEEKLSKERS